MSGTVPADHTDRTDRTDDADGHDPSTVLGAAAAAAARQIDPRAVRVALTPAFDHAELPPLVVEPPPVPVAPTPSVLGRGILGGAAERPVSSAGAPAPGGPTEVLIDGGSAAVRLEPIGSGRAVLTVDGATTRLFLEAPELLPDGRGVVRREVVVDGWRIEVDVQSERRAALRDRARRGREESARGGPTEVHAIIPGRIVSVSVAPGEAVVASQQLLVVEAMKMQNELRAPRDGVVSRVAVAPGETIEIGDLLLVLE